MTDTFVRVDALVAHMRELGIRRYRSGDLELELGPAPSYVLPIVDPPVPPDVAEQLAKDADDDDLYHSA